MSVGHLYVFLGEVSVQVPCLFFNGIVFFVFKLYESIYILNISIKRERTEVKIIEYHQTKIKKHKGKETMEAPSYQETRDKWL